MNRRQQKAYKLRREQKKLIGACFVQARASDGRKESMQASWFTKNPAPWLDRAVTRYKRFTESVKQYEHHRPRLAYVVRVYEKD